MHPSTAAVGTSTAAAIVPTTRYKSGSIWRWMIWMLVALVMTMGIWVTTVVVVPLSSVERQSFDAPHSHHALQKDEPSTVTRPPLPVTETSGKEKDHAKTESIPKADKEKGSTEVDKTFTPMGITTTQKKKDQQTTTATTTIPTKKTSSVQTAQDVSKKRIPGTAFIQNHSTSWWESTAPPLHNTTTLVTTAGYYKRHFHSGYRNQIMSLTALVMWTAHHNHSYLLLDTLHHKDTYGTDRMVPFDYLFDVEKWNAFVPTLPRLVRCVDDFSAFSCQSKRWTLVSRHATNPHPFGDTYTQLFSNYMRYARGKGPLAVDAGVASDDIPKRHPAEIAMYQGAITPHPELRQWMKEVLLEQMATNDALTQQQDQTYFTLHARIEPDMQKHVMCPNLKVLRLSAIFDMMKRVFPIPPAPHLFLPINRPLLEKGAFERKNANKTNWIAVDNLRTLNQAVEDGLWNGTVQVFELGEGSLVEAHPFHPRTRTPSIMGAVMNMEVAIQSTLFIGTPVSSWSHDVTASRFYRHDPATDSTMLQNYRYTPQGIEVWTDENTVMAPMFQC